MRARIGIALTVDDGKPRSSSTAAIGSDTFIVSGLPQAAVTPSRRQRARSTCAACDAALVGEREDPLGPRVERLVHRMPEPGHLPAARMDAARDVLGDIPRCPPSGHLLLRVLEQPRALLGGAQHDGPAPEDPRRDRALQRVGVGGERHPGRDVRRHHPVLGDRDEQDVEEEPLLVRRLAAREEQVEVLGEAEPAHQVAGQVAAANLDPVRVGLGDPADGRSRRADLHGPIFAHGRPAPPP